MTDLVKSKFKVGDIVRWREDKPCYAAKKGALAIIESIGPKYLKVVWLDKSTSEGQMDGNYAHEDFELAEDNPVPVKTESTVDHPAHYNQGKFEVIDIIEESGLAKDFHLANAIKYILRCSFKGNFVQDLEKAIWYINRRIELEKKKNNT